MVEYCEAVIRRIQDEEDSEEVRGIVLDSIEEFTKRSQNTGRYVVNMIVMLQSLDTSGSEARVHTNLEQSLRLFKEYYRQDYGILF